MASAGYTVFYDDWSGEGDYWFATRAEALAQARAMAAAKAGRRPKYASVSVRGDREGLRIFHCDNTEDDPGPAPDSPALDPPWWENR